MRDLVVDNKRNMLIQESLFKSICHVTEVASGEDTIKTMSTPEDLEAFLKNYLPPIIGIIRRIKLFILVYFLLILTLLFSWFQVSKLWAKGRRQLPRSIIRKMRAKGLNPPSPSLSNCSQLSLQKLLLSNKP